ncbi:hypothetical protein Fcan01_11154 [Folsomia candida]|uniref:Uncharacterized protein n=1 Tax=Folsomia candida TaxID=158441 RepID=A0A226EC91_FOLCA|nr:hypothetical protein Fcan01_11154 [Folsomia candida]
MWSLFNEASGGGDQTEESVIRPSSRTVSPPPSRPSSPVSVVPHIRKLKLKRNVAIELLVEDMAVVRAELAKPQPDHALLQRKSRTIQQLTEEAEQQVSEVLDYYVQKNMGEKFRQDRKSWKEMSEDVIELTTSIKSATSPSSRPVSPAGSANSATSSGGSRRVKLPKFELLKFSGKIREWLEWWAYFAQIHEDTSLSTSDKFRYLVQSMESGGEASDIVASFPKSPENYQKAIDMLTEKYGKKDMLVSLYMTDLAELLFNKEKGSLSKFYVNLQTQLQNLESLGVKSEQSSQYLLPMVLKSLPRETLTAWYRSTLSKVDVERFVPPKSRLDCLLMFLKEEVESEWKIELAYGEKEEKVAHHHPLKEEYDEEYEEEELTTAAGLLSSIHLQREESSPIVLSHSASAMASQECSGEVLSRQPSSDFTTTREVIGWRDCYSTVELIELS